MRAKYSLCYSTGAVPKHYDPLITVRSSEHIGRTCAQCKINRWLRDKYRSLLKPCEKDVLLAFLRQLEKLRAYGWFPPKVEHVASRSDVNLRQPIGLTGFSRLGDKPYSDKILGDCPGRDRFKLLTSYTTDVPRELGGFVGCRVFMPTALELWDRTDKVVEARMLTETQHRDRGQLLQRLGTGWGIVTQAREHDVREYDAQEWARSISAQLFERGRKPVGTPVLMPAYGNRGTTRFRHKAGWTVPVGARSRKVQLRKRGNSWSLRHAYKQDGRVRHLDLGTVPTVIRQDRIAPVTPLDLDKLVMDVHDYCVSNRKRTQAKVLRPFLPFNGWPKPIPTTSPRNVAWLNDVSTGMQPETVGPWRFTVNLKTPDNTGLAGSFLQPVERCISSK
jgi:hypothetical protein